MIARVLAGDCLTVLPSLEAGSIGAIVTSPPYNIGVRYRSYEDDMPRTEYLNWTDKWMRAARRAMAPEGSFFLNVGAKPTDPWVPLEVAQVARRYFALQNTIHWVKSIAIDKAAAGSTTGLERDLAVELLVGRPLQLAEEFQSLQRRAGLVAGLDAQRRLAVGAAFDLGVDLPAALVLIARRGDLALVGEARRIGAVDLGARQRRDRQRHHQRVDAHHRAEEAEQDRQHDLAGELARCFGGRRLRVHDNAPVGSGCDEHVLGGRHFAEPDVGDVEGHRHGRLLVLAGLRIDQHALVHFIQIERLAGSMLIMPRE